MTALGGSSVKSLNDLKAAGLWPGSWRATVSDNRDPLKLMRVRLIIPEVLGPDIVSDWAWPKIPVLAGSSYGLVFVPPAGAKVWAEFEGWDPNRPIWNGYWAAAPNEQGELPEDFTSEYGEVFGIRSPGGGMIKVDDQANEVSITNPQGDTVTVKDGEILVQSKGTVRIEGEYVRIRS